MHQIAQKAGLIALIACLAAGTADARGPTGPMGGGMPGRPASSFVGPGYRPGSSFLNAPRVIYPSYYGVGLGLPSYYDPYFPTYGFHYSGPVMVDREYDVVDPEDADESGHYEGASSSRYYCDDPPGFYPYVDTCLNGWRRESAPRSRDDDSDD